MSAVRLTASELAVIEADYRKMLPVMNVIHAHWRKANPHRRAPNAWHYHNSSGTVRRATCAYCNRITATCSGKWRETQAFTALANAHAMACAVQYWQRHANIAAPALAYSPI